MTLGGLLRPTSASIRVSWRTDGAVLVAALVLVAVVVAGVVAAQRAVETAEEQSLVAALDAARDDQTRLRISIADRFGSSGRGDPLATPIAAVDDAAERLDPLALSVYGPARHVVDSARFAAVDVDGVPPASPTGIVLRVHDDLDTRATRATGRAPGPTDDRVDGHPVVEVEVSSGTAAAMGWSVGSEILVESDPTDPLFRVFTGVPDPFVVRVTGTLDLDPPADDYWSGDVRLHRPIVADTAVGANFTVYVSIPPDQLRELIATLGGQTALRAEQRRDLDPARVDLSNATMVERAVTSVESSTSATAGPGQAAVTIGLGPVLQEEAARRSVARAAVLVATVGAMAVATATLVQLVRVAGVRRRPWWQQASARGATRTALVLSSLISTAAAVGSGTVIGAAAGRALRAGAPSGAGSDQRELLIAFAVVLVLAALADQIVEARSRLGTDDAPRPASRVRRAVGALVVIVAVASVLTVRRRGLSLDAGSVDAVLLAPIVFVPLAGVVLVAAVLPRIAGRRGLGSLRIGVGRLLGVRRGLAPQSEQGLLPVVGLATCVAVVASAIAMSISTGIEEWSWHDVGAQARVDTSDLDVVDAIAAQPGALVARYGDTPTLVRHRGEVVAVELASLDVAEHRRLTEGTPAEVDLPGDLDVARDDGTLPVVTTGELGGRRIEVGDTISGVGSFDGLEMTVVDVVPGVLTRAADTVLADRRALEALIGRDAGLDLAWFSGPVPADLATDPEVEIVDRAELARARLADPLTGAARDSFIAAGIAAALLSLLAAAAHLVVTMRARRRDVGLLAALGADAAEFARAVRAELLPSVVIGAIVGTIAGGVTIAAFDGRLDLGPLTGADRTPIALDPVATVIVVLAIVLAIAATVWLAGRRTAGDRSGALTVLRAEGAR